MSQRMRVMTHVPHVGVLARVTDDDRAMLDWHNGFGWATNDYLPDPSLLWVPFSGKDDNSSTHLVNRSISSILGFEYDVVSEADFWYDNARQELLSYLKSCAGHKGL